jgi:hypothetical protein
MGEPDTIETSETPVPRRRTALSTPLLGIAAAVLLIRLANS